MFDTEGNRYLDGLSSLFCAQLGYSYGEEMAQVAAAPAAAARLLHRLGRRAPDRDRAVRARSPSSCPATSTTSSSPAAARSPSRRRGSSCASTTSPTASRSARRRSRATSPTTASRSARSPSPACRAIKEPFGPPAIPVTHVANTNAFRAPDGDDEAALLRRLLDEIERRDPGRGPGHGGDDHRRAGPERRRLPGAARRATGRACARSPTATGSCSSPTRSSAASGASASGSASSATASCPTSPRPPRA